jgi:RNA polymerase sigma-70 factor (ECF subfamily)
MAREAADDPLARDRRLAARMCQGDDDAIQRFCREHMPKVYRFALARVRVPSDADDVVQSVMINAARRIETYRGEAPLFAWLQQICRRELARRYSRIDREPPLLSVGSDDALRAAVDAIEASPEDEPERVALRRELSARLHAALDELPEHYAAALEMKYVDELGSKDIAARLGIGDEAAQSLLARARRALREVCETSPWNDRERAERANGSAD